MESATVTGSGATTAVAAQGAGKVIEVLALVVADATANSNIALKDGAGGTTILTVNTDAASMVALPDMSPLCRCSANTLLQITPSAGTFFATVFYRVVV